LGLPVAPSRAPLPAPAELPRRLLELAERHRLIPLLHRHLPASPGTADPVRHELATLAAASTRDALRLAGELRGLVDAFEGAGVRVAAYKGPALAVRAYGDVALRSCSDLDLIVDAHDLGAAERLMRSLGHVAHHRLAPHAAAVFRRVDGDFPWHNADRKLLVELHCRVSSLRFGVDLPTAALLDRATPVPLGGGSVPMLADEDHLLALALHGAKHRWTRMEWVVSFAALQRRAGIEPGAFLERARRLRAGRVALLALRIASETLGIPLPASVGAAAARDPVVTSLARSTSAAWYADGGGGGDATIANLLYNLRLREGALERIRFGGRWLLVPSPEDWGWVRLPPGLAPLYPLLRPLRLAARYAPWMRR
jgi:hypothetical protein